MSVSRYLLSRRQSFHGSQFLHFQTSVLWTMRHFLPFERLLLVHCIRIKRTIEESRTNFPILVRALESADDLGALGVFQSLVHWHDLFLSGGTSVYDYRADEANA